MIKTGRLYNGIVRKKMTCPYFLALCATGLLLSCSNRGLEPEPLGGLTTTTVLLASLPFLPAAEAFHTISGDIERDRERGEDLAAKLRPVYNERIGLLSKCDPIKDADDLASRGLVFIMPMDFPRKHSFNMYPGTTEIWIKGIDEDYEEKTIELIRGDKKALYLMTISSDDPRHDVSVIYAFNQDPVYSEFFKKRHAYKEGFNRRMSAKLKKTTQW